MKDNIPYFEREYKAVEAGKNAFANKFSPENNAALSIMIRNTHRLEKGLTALCRKEVFGLDYIQELVDAFEHMVSLKKFNLQIKWTYDILFKFFNTVDYTQNEILEKAYNKFERVNYEDVSNINEPLIYTEYRNINHNSALSFQQFENLCKQRHSIRQYKNIPVPSNLVKKAAELALQAPSGCNRQPFRIEFINNQNMLQKVSLLPMGIRSFIEQIHAMIFIIGDLSYFFNERDRHLIYIDGALFAMTFMLGLETLGLASCPAHWSDTSGKDEELQNLLGLKQYEQCIMSLVVGYPEESAILLKSQRKSIDDVWSENNVCID